MIGLKIVIFLNLTPTLPAAMFSKPTGVTTSTAHSLLPIPHTTITYIEMMRLTLRYHGLGHQRLEQV